MELEDGTSLSLGLGQIVVFTDDSELAIQAANLVNQEDLAKQMPSGIIMASDHPVRWMRCRLYEPSMHGNRPSRPDPRHAA